MRFCSPCVSEWVSACVCVRVCLHACMNVRACVPEFRRKTFWSRIRFSSRMLRLGRSALPAFRSQAVGRWWQPTSPCPWWTGGTRKTPRLRTRAPCTSAASGAARWSSYSRWPERSSDSATCGGSHIYATRTEEVRRSRSSHSSFENININAKTLKVALILYPTKHNEHLLGCTTVLK